MSVDRSSVQVAGEKRKEWEQVKRLFILFGGYLPVFLTSTQTFHEQVVLNILGSNVDSLGDLMKAQKPLVRKMYVDTLTHTNFQTTLSVSQMALPQSSSGFRAWVLRRLPWASPLRRAFLLLPQTLLPLSCLYELYNSSIVKRVAAWPPPPKVDSTGLGSSPGHWVILLASGDADASNKWSQFEKWSQLKNWAVIQKEVAQLVQKYSKSNQTIFPYQIEN